MYEDKEEEFERFLIEMMKYNNSNSYYEIDDDLFDMCIFDDDGNLLDIDFDKIQKQMYLFFELDIFIMLCYNEVLWRKFYVQEKKIFVGVVKQFR